jgi:flagellar biosynthesis protein FliP
MPIARILLRAVLTLWMAVMVLPLAHAQEMMKSSMVAALAPPESFWVKRASGSSPVHGIDKGRTLPGGKTKAHGVQAAISPRPDVAGLKKKDSIAGALESSKSVPWSIVLGLTLLTLLPALLLSMTPLVRLLVVFHFLRQALGTQTAPSNQILMGLALMMTWFLMQPVLLEVEQRAVTPYSAGEISGAQAIDRGVEPVKRYMLKYAREKDLAVFASAGMGIRPNRKEDLPIQVVVPAYILSELKAGFQIGAVLFLPFLLVDLVVASVTTSIGMMQLPPVVISTPLKILLFVMVDGWNLLADQLIKSF